MATATHVLPFRRKREGRTNYKKRLSLLKSGKTRLVIRRSNRHFLLQLVRYEPDGDGVLATVSSKVLAKHGWTHATKSIPAAYMTGLLMAQRAKELKVVEAIVDVGLEGFRAGGRVAAVIKGVIDGGLALPAKEEIFPTQERLEGKHLGDAAKDIAAMVKKLKE